MSSAAPTPPSLAGLLNHLLSAAPSLSGLLGGKREVSPEEAGRIDPKDVERAPGKAECQAPRSWTGPATSTPSNRRW